jgi:hypothetical protein
MKKSSLLLTGRLFVVVGIVACGEITPVAPVTPTSSVRLPSTASFASANSGLDEPTAVSPRIAEINAALASTNSKVRLAKAELLVSSTWNHANATVLFANDRARGTGAEWVKGDPNRGGNLGVTYQVASQLGSRPIVINSDRATASLASFALLDQQIEEAMSAWRGQKCSAAPITRVAIPANTDPNFVDQFFSGQPTSGNYVQTADIVQGGWKSAQFFRNIGQFFYNDPSVGNNIIGITFTFDYIDENGQPTDLDRNHKEDIGLAEIYYNNNFVWDNSALVDLRVVDFYSIITHETGHSLGLGHFGKVFVTTKDAADGITLSEIKYAPYAIMNAVYVAGRNELAGTDNSSYCSLWSGK